MQLSIKTDFSAVQKRIDAVGKQATFAAAVALTKTAQDVRKDLRREMQRAFDRPTTYTLNSLFIKPATKARLQAIVWVKDSDRPTHYLLPQIEGGRRSQKRFEELLRRRGIMGSSERAVPGAGARIDRYGNMAASQIIQILSQLNAFNLSGFSANATGSQRSRVKRAKAAYFYARRGESRFGRGSWKRGEKNQHLPSGIYVKTAAGIKPVLLFVSGANYAKRFRFGEVAQATARRVFAGHFDAALATALKTAR